MAIYLIDKIQQKNDGNFFLVDAVDVEYNQKSIIQALADGDIPVKGATGAEGGNKWYVGSTDPQQNNPAGNQGDFYLNTTSYDLFRAGEDGNWSKVGNIRGGQGDTGAEGPQGPKGEGFSISKVYASVEEMNSGYASDGLEQGDFVIITSDVESEDNAKLYVKGPSQYDFVTDMSGATGIQGEQGIQGIQGISLRMKGAWAAETSYVNNTSYIDLVTHEGQTYACLEDHTSSADFATDNAKWILIAQKGADGAQGEQGPAGQDGKSAYEIAVENGDMSGSEEAWLESLKGEKGDTGNTGATGTSMRMKGSWAAETDYVNDAQYVDIVVNGGATYACTTSHHSSAEFTTDAANWIMIAAKGDIGAQGIKGDKGDKGDAFSIAKIYASVAEMNEGFATDDVPQGGFVLINTGNVEDADNAKLYVKDAEAYVYLTDLSGSAGIQGPPGEDGAAGATGATGTSMRMKGAWATGTSYVNDASYIDLVTYNGNTYAAVDSHMAGASFEDDTAHWNLIAAAGAAGAQGEQGPAGETPTVTINEETGNWVINGEETQFPSRGEGVEEGISDKVATLEQQVAELLYNAPEIKSFTSDKSSAQEKGSTVDTVNLSWTFNKAMVKVELDSTNITTEAEGTSGSKQLTGQNITQNKTYTLKVTDEREATAQKSTSISFVAGNYYGKSSITDTESINNAFILGLTKRLSTNIKTKFTVTANAGEYIYYAFPATNADPTFSVGGFDGGFDLVKTFDFQNASGHTESYKVFRSTNPGLGETTVEFK